MKNYESPESSESQPSTGIPLLGSAASMMHSLFSNKSKTNPLKHRSLRLEQLDSREMLSATPTQLWVDTEGFNQSTKETTFLISSPFDSSTIQEPGKPAKTITHIGGANELPVPFSFQLGNSNRYATIVTSGGQKVVTPVQYHNGTLMEEKDAWLLQPQTGNKAWGDLTPIEGSTIGELIPEGAEKPEPSMHATVNPDKKSFTITFNSSGNATYFEMDWTSMPQYHAQLGRVLVNHKGGIANATVTLPLESNFDSTSSAQRPIRMINAEEKELL